MDISSGHHKICYYIFNLCCVFLKYISYFHYCIVIAHVARARLRDRHQENLKKKLEVLKAQQRMDESQFDPEEGSSRSREQIPKVNEPSEHDKPSTSSKKSPIEKEESQSSAEDIR